MLSRLVRIVNIGLALLVLVVAFAAYWYAVRPLPETEGELAASIASKALVKRDARGVPHIEASSWQDAIFLQGFVTAQDRLWQMDTLRRFAAGELSEVFGPAALHADEGARRMRMRAIAEANVARLKPTDRAVLVQYARGVNYFIDTHRGQLQLEFSLPGHVYQPRPWTLADTLLVGLAMFRDLSDTWQFDFDKGMLLAQGGDSAKVHTLFPPLQGLFVSPGSNAWAVSGAHTSDGKPMLANDPHLSYSIPPTWYLVHLKAPGLDVTGASLPGVPCVIAGHNAQIAWGVTNVQADVMDIYAEQLDTRTGRYVFQGKMEQAQLDRQVIGVKGAKPVSVDVWVTRHGPVIAQSGNTSYSMRWSATDGFSFAFFDVDRARDWTDFRSAVHDFWGPGQNFVYADTLGNIGYQATGRFPIRHNFHGDVPLDGSSGNFEWDGYIPFEQLPSIYNPASGILVTANQNPFGPGYPYQVDGNYHDRYRVEQIRARLSAKPGLTVTDMLAVQKDVYSAYDRFLANQVVAAYTRQPVSDNLLINQAVGVLRGWNGQMDKDAAAPLVTELLHAQLGAELVDSLSQNVAPPSASQKGARLSPQSAAEKSGGRPAASASPPLSSVPKPVPHILPRPEVIQDLLRARPKGWVPNNDWDSWLLKNLAVALDTGRQRQGSPVSKWKWGRQLQWKLTEPVGNQLPFVSSFFDIGPVPMSGSGSTVKQTTATLGPSERMVVALGDWDRSVQNLTVGESGHVASRHYKDQWPAYYAGFSFPMQFTRVSGSDVLRVRPAK